MEYKKNILTHVQRCFEDTSEPGPSSSSETTRDLVPLMAKSKIQSSSLHGLRAKRQHFRMISDLERVKRANFGAGSRCALKLVVNILKSAYAQTRHKQRAAGIGAV